MVQSSLTSETTGLFSLENNKSATKSRAQRTRHLDGESRPPVARREDPAQSGSLSPPTSSPRASAAGPSGAGPAAGARDAPAAADPVAAGAAPPAPELGSALFAPAAVAGEPDEAQAAVGRGSAAAVAAAVRSADVVAAAPSGEVAVRGSAAAV